MWTPCESSDLHHSQKSLCCFIWSSVSEWSHMSSNQKNLKLASTKHKWYLSTFLRNNLLTKTIKPWKILPNDTLWSLSLDTLKARPALSNLVQPWYSPCFQQEDGYYPEVPSSLNYLVIPQASSHSSKPKVPNICFSNMAKHPSG